MSRQSAVQPDEVRRGAKDLGIPGLDMDRALWHCPNTLRNLEQRMRRPSPATLLAAGFVFVLSASSASSGSYSSSGPYPFGDPPSTLNWDYYPQIQTGCWKWNWQQHQWDDHCPAYVQPKAYMYPRSRPVVLRTRG